LIIIARGICNFSDMAHKHTQVKYAWYLDITPNRMFSLYDDYPISGKTRLLSTRLIRFGVSRFWKLAISIAGGVGLVDIG